MKAILKKLLANRLLLNLFSAVIYVLVFRLAYVQYLYPVWGYMGYKYFVHSRWVSLLTIILAVFPILFYKARKIPSDFISIFVYIFIVAPSIISMEYGFANYNSVVLIQIFYSLSMIAFFSIKYHDKVIHRTKENAIPVNVYYVAVIIVLLTVIATYHSNMRFASVEEVYDLREETAEINTNPIVGYFMLWLANFFSPLFVATGLVKKNIKIVLLGFFCAIVVYMSTALKSAFFTPLFCLLVFSVVKKRNHEIISLFPSIVLFFSLLYFIGAAVDNNLAFVALSLFIMRTFGISALLTPGYITVFNSMPHTYYSHVRIINSITGMYPFSEPVLGKAVWSAYTGEADAMNANANMLLTDGIAACGLPGVVLVSLLFIIILKYLNSISVRHDMNFVLTLLIGVILSLSNASLFTVLLSSGLLLIMFLLRFTKIDNRHIGC